MLNYLKFILLFNIIIIIWAEPDELNTKAITTKNFMFWPNATIPFYVNPDHFDQEQTVAIMTALSIFAFKTCLKFAPVMDAPQNSHHVMVFVNPEGIKRCKFETSGHSVFEPHTVLLGYDCLKSPQIDMMIMRALGFPFEHNRLSRDLFINVMLENIEPGAVELFTKDIGLPIELRAQPYDVNSVMHFGQRDFSKNGHRTIIFKKENVHQNRIGLSPTDLKKIDIVYGPECQKRDRQEKIELCQSYPGVARRKREVEVPTTTSKSLRVNRNITPPPTDQVKDVSQRSDQENRISNSLKELGIEDHAQEVVDQVYKVSSEALKLVRDKHCNKTDNTPITFTALEKSGNSDILGILEVLADYTKNTIEKAISNMTIFCKDPNIIAIQRSKCHWSFGEHCRERYYSTKSGHVYHSTNHRPYIIQSTKHKGQAASYSYDHVAWRARNESAEVTTEQIKSRRKRAAPETKPTPEKKSSVVKDKLQRDKDTKEGKEKVKTSKGTSTKDTSSAKRRFFETRRYKVKTQSNKSELDWAGSDLSEENHNTYAKEAREKEIREAQRIPGNSPAAPGKMRDEERGRVLFGEKIEPEVLPSEVVVREENLGKEAVIEDESDIETTTPVKKKFLVQKNKPREKKKIRDSYELLQEKKMQEERLAEVKEEPRLMKRPREEIPETVKLTKLNREFYHERMWPEGVVRYVISPLDGYDLDDMRNRLLEVAAVLKKRTCVRLEEVSEEEAKNYEDYLVLDTSPDYVTGRVGGVQHFGCIELFRGGQHKQHAAMMVMAMLGFYFEVARHDRDKYIRVHMRHVRPDKLHHFEKIRDEATLALPYDFDSATHPAWQFWRKIGKTGISTVATYKVQDPDGSVMRALGQHDQLLSDSDIIKINSIYGIECFTEPEEMRASDHSKKSGRTQSK